MKRVSDREKTIVWIPVILEPIEVEVPLVAIVSGFGNVPVAVRILPDRTNVQDIVSATTP